MSDTKHKKEINQKILQFFSQYSPLHFSANEIIVRAGNQPAGIIYLTEGHVRQSITSTDGYEFVVNIYRPDSFFPMTWGFHKVNNRHDFVAITQVKGWQAPREQVLSFLEQNPDVLMDLTARAFSGIDNILFKLEHVVNSTAYDRVIVALLNLAYRYGATNDGVIRLPFQLKQREMAEMTGLTRETFSREIHKLIDKKFVILEKDTIVIPSMKKLEKELKNSESLTIS